MSKSAARGQETQHTAASGSSGAATDVLSILKAAVDGPSLIRIRCCAGSVAGEPDADAVAKVEFVRRRALRRLLWLPWLPWLGLVRAYVSGDTHIEGDIFDLTCSAT